MNTNSSAWSAHRAKACGLACWYCAITKKVQRTSPLTLPEFQGKNRLARWAERKVVKRQRRAARLKQQLEVAA